MKRRMHPKFKDATNVKERKKYIPRMKKMHIFDLVYTIEKRRERRELKREREELERKIPIEMAPLVLETMEELNK